MTDVANSQTDEELAAELGEALAGEPKGGISSQDVAGEKAKPPTAPDSTALRDRLEALRNATRQAEPKQDPKELELQQLREAVTQLSAIHKFQASGMTPQQMLERENSPQTLAQRAIEEAKKAREEAQSYRERMDALEQERQLKEVQAGVKSFVASHKDHFPLINKLDSADLAFQVMHDNPGLSEAEAAAQVESQLVDFIVRGAETLGYVKANESKATETRDADVSEPPTLNPSVAGTTSSKSWDQMTDDERDAELVRQLKAMG